MESRVREGARGSSERKEEDTAGQWTTVLRRKEKKCSTMATKTCFIDSLPINTCSYDLEKYFSPYGPISSIYIPPKLRPQRNVRYAFIKFQSSHSAEMAIKRENGRRMLSGNLNVKFAKADKQLPRTPTWQPHHRPKTFNNDPPPPKPLVSKRDHRTYKQACTGSSPNQTSPPTQPIIEPSPTKPPPPAGSPIPVALPTPLPECFRYEPSAERKLSSRILGEEVEKIRDNLEVKEIDGETLLTIKGKKGNRNAEILGRSVVATALSTLSSSEILSLILAEGINSLTIKPLGGLLHLITFLSVEEKEAFMECKWLEQWFHDIQDVAINCSAKWRKTWVNVYGVPIWGWEYENFFDIGCTFGKVLSVEMSNLNKAKILIITDCFFHINCEMALDMEGYLTKIHIFEEKDNHNSIQKECQLSPIKVQSSSCSEQPNQEEAKNDAMCTDDVSDDDVNNLLADRTNKKNLSSSPNSQKTRHTNQDLFSLNNHQSPIINQSLNDFSSTHESPTNIMLGAHNTKKTDLMEPKKNRIMEIEERPPKKPTTSPDHKLKSPIPTSNRFGLLLRPSYSSNSSSSLPDPLFPPGFESNISPDIKQAQVKKRARKILKRKKSKKPTLPQIPPSPDHPPTLTTHNNGAEDPNTHILTASNTMNLAKVLGLDFSGPMGELQERVEEEIQRQNADWAASQE